VTSLPNSPAAGVVSPEPDAPAWLVSAASLLTLRRLRAQAIVLALCLWGVCAIDFAAPGLFDRAGNIKFQDFLPVYVSARLVAEHRASELYNPQSIAVETKQIIHEPTRVVLPNLYGPQVAFFFTPLARFSFQSAARIWVALSTATFFACIVLIWKSCPALYPHAELVFISALAFPPLFHFFVRGQISALPLACFTAAFLAFHAERNWIAGIALGFLVLKPQFLVAVPLVLLLSLSWKALGGLALSAAAQLGFAQLYFGTAVMRSYFDMLRHVPRWIADAELSLAPIQMHSLRSFWTLLIPYTTAAIVLYALSSCVAIAIAATIWKSSAPLAIRFSALTLAAVLVNPHLFVYDLLVLAPVFLLLANWTLTHESPAAFRLLLYLAFVTPLLGPLSQWTHLQLSVPVFFALLYSLRKTPGHSSDASRLDSTESRVV